MIIKILLNQYVEASFIQLNPTLSIRRNIYFMNQYLYVDDFLVSIFHDENEVSKKRTLFSRNEEYSLFQGLKRNEKYTDYGNFAVVYLRADTKKTVIKRKYQKIAEFYADVSSLLLSIFNILIIIFGFLNKFWGEQYLYNKLFFFQDLNLNINNKEDKIKQLIFITDLNKNNNDMVKNNRNEKVKISTLKMGSHTSKNIINLSDELPQSKQNIGDFDFNNNEKISNSYQEKSCREEYKDNNINSKNNFINIITTKSISNYLVNNNDKKYNLTTTNKNANKKDKEFVNIEYEYYLSDYVKTIFSKCKCCESKKLKIKNSLKEKANSFFYNKLDITLYMRHIILFDIMKDILLDTETKNIVNFLEHPIISLSNNEENELSLIYNKYNESDFDKFYNEIIRLSNKDEKSKEEIRLMSLSNKHLKKLYI